MDEERASADTGSGIGRRRFVRAAGVSGIALIAAGARGSDEAGAATGSWSLNGNAGTTPPSNFLGTTDAQALVFKTGNVERARILASGPMGIGIAAPSAQLHAKGAGRHAIEGDTASPAMAGVVGKNTASNAAARGVAGSVADGGFGVRGDAGSGYGVYGTALGGVGVGGTSNNIGVRGNGTLVGVDAITGTDGIGVRAVADGVNAMAVRGDATSGGTGVTATSDSGAAIVAIGSILGVYGGAAAGGSGVSGTISGDNAASRGVSGTVVNLGCGVYGSAGAGFGVYGTADAGGIGVGGANTTDTATSKGVAGSVPNRGYGVYGSAGTGFGVYGTATIPTGVGVGGVGASGGGTGVSGTVPDLGYGVKGTSNGAGVGVYGTASIIAGGLAGRFDGDVTVNGTMRVAAGFYLLAHDASLVNLDVSGTKHFKIDHPQDPANKFLVHACVESDEVLNVYRGAVVLDGHGRATVQLPTYFDALNRDAMVQLTGVGRGHVYVESEVAAGRFTIGGDPGQKVFWNVTAARHDAHMQAHPMQVEVDKVGNERSRYLAPELHGAPAEQRIG